MLNTTEPADYHSAAYKQGWSDAKNFLAPQSEKTAYLIGYDAQCEEFELTLNEGA